MRLNVIPESTVSLAVTSTTGRVALFSNTESKTLYVGNTGTSVLYFRQGDSTVNATTASVFLGPNASITVDRISGATHVAAITDSGNTATLKVALSYESL